jgi:Family of unknown function (DUF6279)
MSDRPVADPTRIIRAPLLALLFALLSGCSLLRLSYPQLPTIAYWTADSYLDLTSAQSEQVRAQLAELLRWNRATQLPDYAALLRRARAEVTADTTPTRVCQWMDEATARARTAFEQALPAAAEMALTLTPAQLDHLRKHLDKTNADFREEFVERSPERRRKEAVKRAVDRAETLYNKLDDAQRERIAGAVAASPFEPERWLAERQLRQREALQTLRRLQAERAGADAMQAALRAFFERAQASPDDAYRAYQQRLRQFSCEAAARLHNTTNPEQRQAAAATIAGWESDLRALAAEAER